VVNDTYIETFEAGPGGWYGWESNAAGPRPLESLAGCVVSRSPWWIDYNHAPPGAGYMHLLFSLNTAGAQTEHQREVAGSNRFVEGGHGTDFTDARLTFRLKGELLSRDASFILLCQGFQGGICSGWVLTGQPLEVTADWSTQTIVATADESQWTAMGTRHDRTDSYGRFALRSVLADLNANIMLVLFPLTIEPMGPLDGDPHILRPERDYPVWRSRLPEGYVALDEVRIDFATPRRT
jgi:hypothetical protein